MGLPGLSDVCLDDISYARAQQGLLGIREAHKLFKAQGFQCAYARTDARHDLDAVFDYLDSNHSLRLSTQDDSHDSSPACALFLSTVYHIVQLRHCVHYILLRLEWGGFWLFYSVIPDSVLSLL